MLRLPFLVLLLCSGLARAEDASFAAVGKGIFAAVKGGKPLAPFVQSEGFELTYGGSDRVDGTKNASPVKLAAKKIDEKIEVVVKADGRGWMVEESKQKPKARTFKHVLRIADELRHGMPVADLDSYLVTSLDEKARKVTIGNTSVTVEFALAKEGEGKKAPWKIRTVALSEDDPG